MALESARGDTTVKSSGGPTELPPQFGRYRVKQKLGGGGMGSVYLVENTELEREEALKVPHFEAGDDTQLRERFLREAKSAAKLDHANLCPVYDAGVRDGICYLTMRYLEGKLLTEYTGKAQPARKAVEIATKLAQALEAAHGKGVIHRDLKPSNIMMVAGVGPVVMDFGLAKLVRQPDKTLTQAGATIGTPAYMPPEQVHGDVEQMGPASDVYTLGVILYELLTGRLPFEGTTGAIFGKILYTEPPLPSALVPGLNPVLDGICRKAMAKAATDRYPSMKAFAAALVEYLRSTPATAGAGNLVSTAVDKAAIFQAPTVAPGPRVDGSTSFASTRSVEGGNRSLARPDSLPSGLADHPVYDNIRELGHGGMGVVYLAHNRLVDRDEVLKVLSPGLMGQAGIEERFLREIRAVAKLRHPNIVAAYIAFRLGESIVFAMEYIKGQDLSKLVKLKGPLPVGHACHFIQQAAQGLQHAFEQGMVHRDIKPGNLMLSRRGDSAVIKILDFGLAKAAREQEADTGLAHAVQMLGTPDYVAPEQIRNAQGADVRADIYSLGCTLYYLLTGGPPFQAASPYDLLQAHHSMYAKPLNLLRPEVPSELAAVVARMMAKEPEQRFQTPSAVAEALKPFGKLSSAEFKSTRPEPSGSKSTEVDESETYGLAVEEMPASPGRYSNLVKTVVATPSRTRRPSRIDVDKLDHLEPPPPAPSGAEGWSPAWQTLILAAPFIVILLGIVIYVVTDKGRIKITVDGPKVAVKVDGENVLLEELDKPITLRAGEHTMTVTRDKVETETRNFVLRRGESQDIHIEYEPVVKDVGRIRITVDGPKIAVKVDGETVLPEEMDEPITLRAGEHTMTVVRDKTKTETHKFVVLRGENEDLHIEDEPKVTDKSAVPDDPKTISNSLGMKLTLIPAGEFLMGSSKAEDKHAADGEEPRHRVRITRPFYMGVTEVTQRQYRKLTGQSPSFFQGPENLPVDQVSWFNAVAFCNTLSTRENLTPYYRIEGASVTIVGGKGYRLPTEAEWEYACRAGSTTIYSFGDDPSQVGNFGWYGPNSRDRKSVGEKTANAFGLYDMHGNVFEWCWDGFDPLYYSQSPPDDPTGPNGARDRVFRGGGCTHGAESLRSADRGSGFPDFRNLALGFRVARNVPSVR